MAHRASGETVILLRARSPAALAGVQPGDLNFGAHALHHVGEFDLEIVTQIFAALGTRAPPTSTTEHVAKAEQIAQNIAEIGEGGRVNSSSPLHTLMAIAVVRR